GYFAHETPEGLSPFDRMRAANVRFLVAGENLALAPTLSLAHTGLMNSPGHRANILRPQFGRVGIGIMDGGMRGLRVAGGGGGGGGGGVFFFFFFFFFFCWVVVWWGVGFFFF